MGIGICSDIRPQPHKLCTQGLNSPDDEQGKELTRIFDEKESSQQKRDSSESNMLTCNNYVFKLETSNSVACFTYTPTDWASNREVLTPESKQHISKSSARNSISVEHGELESSTVTQLSKPRDILTPMGAKEEIRFSGLSIPCQSGMDDDSSPGSSVRKTSEGKLRELGILGAYSSLQMSSSERSSAENQHKVPLIE